MSVCDIERIVGRVAVGRAGPRDLAALGRCMGIMPEFLDQLEKLSRSQEVAPELVAMRGFCQEQAKYLQGAILSDPAVHLREGGVICDGFDAELDRLREIGSELSNVAGGISGEARRRDEHPQLESRL